MRSIKQKSKRILGAKKWSNMTVASRSKYQFNTTKDANYFIVVGDKQRLKMLPW